MKKTKNTAGVILQQNKCPRYMYCTHILNNDKNGLIKAANSSLLHVCIYIGNTNTGIYM